MKANILLASIFALTLTSTAMAELTFKENKTSGQGYTSNMNVTPPDQNLELSKRFFSYDHNKIVFDHQYDAAKPLIDSLSLSDQTKIMIFWYGAALERELDANYFDQNDVGTVTLANILAKSPYDTSGVKTMDQYNDFMLFALQDKMNNFFPVTLKKIKGNILTFNVKNLSSHNLARLKGNLRVSQNLPNNVGVSCANYPISVMVHAPRYKQGQFRLNIDLEKGGFDKNTPLTFTFTSSTIEFLDRAPFNSTAYYNTIQGNKPKFNDKVKSPLSSN